MKIFGLQLYPKRKNDAEYVESVRKIVRRTKWLAVFHGIMALFFFGCYLVMVRMIYSAEPQVPGFAESISTGLRIGVMLGAFIGALLVFGAVNVKYSITLLKGQRTERLMLKFHDELRKKESDCQGYDG